LFVVCNAAAAAAAQGEDILLRPTDFLIVLADTPYWAPLSFLESFYASPLSNYYPMVKKTY
jgi:hypothetical protein